MSSENGSLELAQRDYFVVSVGKKTEAFGPFTADEADEVASTGIGTINYITKTVLKVDRTKVDPEEVAKEAMTVLSTILAGRRHSSSPQCLPVAQYRELERLAAQYKSALDNQLEKTDAYS